MARIHVMGACALGLFAAAMLVPTPVLAAPDPVQLLPDEIPDLPDGRRSYAQAAFTKVRPGASLLGPDTVPPAPDTQGELGHKRDALVRRHYAHMAELDVAAEAAMRARDVSLAERAETMRRKEIQSFFLAMQQLRRQLLKQQAEKGP